MTLKRVRRYALVAGIALWTVFVADYATPGPLDRLGKIKGTDFVQFYASGSLVLGGRADRLYDHDTLQAAIRAAVPEARETIYVPMQSPQLLFLLTPLAALPYTVALTVWLMVIVGLYAAACAVLWLRCRNLHGYRREAIACAVAFPGLYATVIHGQPSVFASLAIAVALIALERGRGLEAGLALGCLAFKPHWVVAAGVLFLFAREWKVLIGMGVSALVQLGATVVVAGPRLFLAYLTTLESIGRLGDILEPRPGYGLRSFFSVFVPNPQAAFVLYLMAAAAVAIVAARTWRSPAAFDVRASGLLLAIVLVNPHVFEYDLVVLTPVFFLVANAIAGGLPIGLGGAGWTWAIAALFVAPVLTAVPPAIRLQFSATAMVAILFRIGFFVRNERSAAAVALRSDLVRG
ncbi:MAG TPA: glycosyltransferase family 87 protein [Vicinamibacterales bacterium]